MGSENPGRLTWRVRMAGGFPSVGEPTSFTNGEWRVPATLVEGIATKGTTALDDEAPGVVVVTATLMDEGTNSLSD